MRNAIYALSADPITYGHIDVIKRAAKIFDHLYVGIGCNPDKKYLFTEEERVELASQALDNIPNVTVISFSGLLVNFAVENNIHVIVRGIRNSFDMEFESNLNQVNKSQEIDIETICLFTDPVLSKVSSSNVKALQKDFGNISEYVPLNVKAALQEKISKVKLIGFTGLMGSGKSYLANKLEDYSKTEDTPVHNIELDDVAKYILYESNQPMHQNIQNKFFEYFQTKDKKEIASKLFSSKENLDFVSKLIAKPIQMEVINRITKNKLTGIVIINSAILCESNLLDFVNNKVVLISNPEKDTHLNRLLEKRGISEEEYNQRSKFVLNYDEKFNFILNKINTDYFGSFTVFNSFTDIKHMYNMLKEI